MVDVLIVHSHVLSVDVLHLEDFQLFLVLGLELFYHVILFTVRGVGDVFLNDFFEFVAVFFLDGEEEVGAV